MVASRAQFKCGQETPQEAYAPETGEYIFLSYSDYLIYELKKDSKYFPFPLAAVEVHRFRKGGSLEPLFLPIHRNLNDMWDFDLVTRMWSMEIENLTKMGLSPV